MTLDVSYIARGLTLTDRFRGHVEERRERIEQLAEGAGTLEVKVTKASHHRHSEETVRVELTVRGAREVVRSEADADDKLAAFDAASARLAERLRRLRDRRKDRRHGKGTSSSRGVAEVAFVPPLPATGQELEVEAQEAAGVPASGTPVSIRAKSFPATPMTVEQAVDAMELVGHDFYLFQDAETATPSVVYRRRGWSYGVLTLDPDLPADYVDSADGGERPYRAEADAEADADA